MQNLIDYLTTPRIDGHIHLFSDRRDEGGNLIMLPTNLIPAQFVGFPDIEFDHECKTILPQYEEFLHRYERICRAKLPRLLATSCNYDEIPLICEKYYEEIIGIGELKMYDTYNGRHIGRHNLSQLNDLMAWNGGKYPVYIHYDIASRRDVQSFEKFVETNPSTNIVLCHCGISNDVSNVDTALYVVPVWLQQYDNLYVDLTWGAAQHFSRCPNRVKELREDKLILGTDISPRSVYCVKPGVSPSVDQINHTANILVPYVSASDKNICRLFRDNIGNVDALNF